MLGVCYYPEHWPQELWAADAHRMKALGLSVVRIGEFAWSRFEPEPGRYDFAWFDAAIETLVTAGLKLVLCTPTATPPKWLIDAHPDILPVDPLTGHVRGFGSRRHYDFSSEVYLREALRISAVLAQRYGQHPGVIGWQTDNELCCHDTVLSISAAALQAFRAWCFERYGTIEQLNAAWGNVFWSMEYRSFDEIEVPFGAVTETNPAHRMAYQRFSSDQVVHWHRALVAVLREHIAPHHFVTHNFIPMQETGVNNFELAAPLDFASYDNYPLGRADLALAAMPGDEFKQYMRTGHPDFQAFVFDQTRCLTPARRFWIMEQQPGPVNWAPHNARPATGMVRLWTWEAIAHGADCVSYFRWRQAPFAQEQMHAGLLRPDSVAASAWPEIEAVVREMAGLDITTLPSSHARVALMVDPEAEWLSDIERQGAGYDYRQILLDWYRAARELGLDLDIVQPDTDLTGYAVVLVPCLALSNAAAVLRLAATTARVLLGPRSGAKAVEVTIPDGLAPGNGLRALAPVRVTSVETLRPDMSELLHWNGGTYASRVWREAVEVVGGEVTGTYEDGSAAVIRNAHVTYLATLTDDAFMRAMIAQLCTEAGVALQRLPPNVRLRQRGDVMFAFNYGASGVVTPAPAGADFLIGGGPTLEGHDLVAWRLA